MAGIGKFDISQTLTLSKLNNCYTLWMLGWWHFMSSPSTCTISGYARCAHMTRLIWIDCTCLLHNAKENAKCLHQILKIWDGVCTTAASTGDACSRDLGMKAYISMVAIVFTMIAGETRTPQHCGLVQIDSSLLIHFACKHWLNTKH